MTDSMDLIAALDRRVERRDERREFFKAAFGMGALAVGGAATLGFAKRADAQTATITDPDILNFALNLEYLEAQFYAYAATGNGLAADLLTGAGTQGAVVGGQKANLTDPVVIQYAREIAADEVAHVAFLRSQLTTSAVAQPAINIAGDANGAFTAAARAAGVVGETDAFNPYANDDSFLLGAYLFEDVGVTAYKGAAPLISSNAFLDAAAGILAAEAFHAGIIRGALYARGVATPALRINADRISDARDTLDGTAGANNGDLDQGISPVTTPLTSSLGATSAPASNFVPTDANGIAFSRTPAQVLNIVYLNRAAATMGGFFPNGVNGTIRASVA